MTTYPHRTTLPQRGPHNHRVPLIIRYPDQPVTEAEKAHFRAGRIIEAFQNLKD